MRHLFALTLLSLTVTAFMPARADEYADPWWDGEGAYEDPFDKPKDKGPFFEDEGTPKEDRVKTEAPAKSGDLSQDWKSRERKRPSDIVRGQLAPVR